MIVEFVIKSLPVKSEHSALDESCGYVGIPLPHKARHDRARGLPYCDTYFHY